MAAPGEIWMARQGGTIRDRAVFVVSMDTNLHRSGYPLGYVVIGGQMQGSVVTKAALFFPSMEAALDFPEVQPNECVCWPRPDPVREALKVFADQVFDAAAILRTTLDEANG